ncbi:MAG: hypothetical protein ACOY0S_00750, partial [Patescibacteria group bacterium]
MKLALKSSFILLIVFFIYFGVSSQFTFKPKWFLDYLNPMAASLRQFHLDLVNPPITYDLAYFQGKWYAPWGLLPALLLIPAQIVLGRYVPAIYLSLFLASLNVLIMYYLLLRLRKEFFPQLSQLGIWLVLVMFAFGTAHFYVGTLGGVWHVEQMVSTFLGVLGFAVIFRQKRQIRHYVIATILFGLALLARATVSLMVVLPFSLYFWEHILQQQAVGARIRSIKRALVIFGVPLMILMSLFFWYNYLRFNDPFEYGFNYIQEAPYLEQLRQSSGIRSLANVPRNLWYMVGEIPSLSWEKHPILRFNLNGNSIFFLTPPLLAIFLALPITKIKGKWQWHPYLA